MSKPTEQRYPSSPAKAGEQQPGGKRNTHPYYKAITIHPQKIPLNLDESLDGDELQQQLVELLRQRYAITRCEADQQVKDFIQSCKG